MGILETAEGGAPVTRELRHQGRIINLYTDTVVLGGETRAYDVVTHSGASVIIPRLDANRLILVEQWRHAVGQRLWEVPAGLIEAGESPEIGAARELREETGYTAARLRHLWSGFSAPGFCTEQLHFFLAEDLTQGEREPDEGEESMIVRTFEIAELQRMIERGEITDMKTMLAIMWAANSKNTELKAN